MRLTLRTLLAYMDDVLDPSDQEELGRKIEASPFATELIHRSRDAVRRLRLSAPEVLAGASGDLHEGDPNLDANTAAEYLDNTLSPEQVAEFERSCLEAGPNADMLLAETASCHHILTLVLGEPAEVDADLRQRMYELIRRAAAEPARVDPIHAKPEPQTVAAAVAVAPAAQPQRLAGAADDEFVPDYMREAVRVHRRKQRQLIAMMVGAALLGGVAAFFLWPQGEAKLPREVATGTMGDVEDLTSGLEVGENQTPGVTGGAAAAGTGSPEDGGAAPVFVPTPFPPADAPASATAADATAGAATADAAATGAVTATAPVIELPQTDATGVTIDPGALTQVPLPADAGATASVDATVTAPADIASADATGAASTEPPPGASDATPPGGVAVGEATVTAPVIPPGPGPVSPNDAPPGGVLAGTGSTPPADTTTAEAPTAPILPPQTEPAPPRQLGVYLGLSNDVLLLQEEGSNTWVRLPPRTTFAGDSRLLVLPTFRTLVVLGADINAFLGGGSELTLRAPTDGSDASLDLPYGHLIINSGAKGNRVRLVMGDQMRVVKLGPAASLAVLVRRIFVPGSDPTKEPAPLEIEWYLTTGTAEWGDDAFAESSAPGMTAQGPASWTTVDGIDQAPQAITELPPWIDKEPITDLDARARDAVAETLVPGQPVNVALLELTGTSGLGRRTEVRALAAASAAYVGEFEPLVKALADPNERAKREEQVLALRLAIARNPAAMEQIREAFALQRGEQAAKDLTEMVLGFNPAAIGATREEVQNGSLVRLVQWLGDEDLTYRVLASYNLNEITGTSYLGGYRPEHAATKRDREIRYYLQRLERGELMPTEWTPTGWATR